jgi:cytochrome d ubiquinol oxidase subunit I
MLALAAFVWTKFLKKKEFPKLFLWAFIISGPLAVIAIESGWIFACTGRQPWIIYRMMKTSEAVTTSADLSLLFFLFLLVYIILGIAVVLVLRYYFKRHPVSEDLAKLNSEGGI